jgi:signal transduction histidine kinase
MTDNFRGTGGSIAVEAPQREELRETLDGLRLEVAELRASRKRLLLAGDADRRAFECDLHDGVQQHLVALSVNLQLAAGLVDEDAAAAKQLLHELGQDVQRALEETAGLAQRIYPPLLEAGGLVAALRSAAERAGIPTRIEVDGEGGCPRELAGTLYFSCVELLERAGAGARATVTVRAEDGALAFEAAEDGAGTGTAAVDVRRIRDRVEAVGGRLTITSEPGRGTRLSGSLPLWQ